MYDASLSASVAAAVRAGTEELNRFDVIVSDARARLRMAWEDLSRGRKRPKRDDVFFVWLEDVVIDLRDTLDASRNAVSTFNIAFFGRTGAGKSTLLSALGGLDGKLVSPLGRSDFTTDVQALNWRGCRLYDTPGINGWGATRPRVELEESARTAVEVADVVLLCFDTQSQQASLGREERIGDN
jgi:tRNA U34 5-carboxymethylaminomethyl modifying GTPase MnmE/TrmE